MEQFTDILQKATEKIAREYFILPLHGADPVYRERVYCYELYHQIRLHWPESSPWRLNGEPDKAAHPDFLDSWFPKPDLLVHQPGTGNNYAVIEVKSISGLAVGQEKDIETLRRFTNEFGYKRGIYLVYGEGIDRTLQLAGPLIDKRGSRAIELWIHRAPGTSAECIKLSA